LKQDYRKAFGLLKEAVEAEPQLSGACIGLALCYENGYGCKVDKVKAFEYYQRSVYQVPVAEADAEGEYSLGNCYFCGIGTSQDFKRAYYWFKRAASLG